MDLRESRLARRQDAAVQRLRQCLSHVGSQGMHQDRSGRSDRPTGGERPTSPGGSATCAADMAGGRSSRRFPDTISTSTRTWGSRWSSSARRHGWISPPSTFPALPGRACAKPAHGSRGSTVAHPTGCGVGGAAGARLFTDCLRAARPVSETPFGFWLSGQLGW